MLRSAQFTAFLTKLEFTAHSGPTWLSWNSRWCSLHQIISEMELKSDCFWFRALILFKIWAAATQRQQSLVLRLGTAMKDREQSLALSVSVTSPRANMT